MSNHATGVRVHTAELLNSSKQPIHFTVTAQCEHCPQQQVLHASTSLAHLDNLEHIEEWAAEHSSRHHKKGAEHHGS